MDLIQLSEIKEIEHRAAEVHLYSDGKGKPYHLLYVDLGSKRGYLSRWRGGPRKFSTFESLRSQADKLGISELNVKMKVYIEQKQLNLV